MLIVGLQYFLLFGREYNLPPGKCADKDVLCCIMKDLEALNLNSWTQMIPDWKKYKQVA
jgi:hypothetical protein